MLTYTFKCLLTWQWKKIHTLLKMIHSSKNVKNSSLFNIKINLMLYFETSFKIFLKMLSLVPTTYLKKIAYFDNYIAHRGISSAVFIFLNPIWFYVEKGLVAKKKFKIDFAHQRIYHNPKWKEFKNQRPKKSWGGTWKGKSSVIWAFLYQSMVLNNDGPGN